MSIQVNLQGRIEEYRGDKNMSITEDYLSLNEEIETFMKKHTIMFLNQLQKWNVDPIGVGKLTLRPFSRPISNKEWSSYWPRMKINVEYRIDFQPIKRMNR